MHFLIYYQASLILGCITALTSGIFVFLTNKKSLVNRTWLGTAFTSAMWSLGYFGMISSTSKSLAWWSNWFLHTFAIFIPAFHLHFVITLIENKKEKYVLISAYSISAILFLINPSHLFIKDVIPKFIFNYCCDAGPLYLFFTIYFTAAIFYSWYLLFISIKRGKRSRSLQLKYFFLSSLFGFIGGGEVFFLTFNIPIPPMGIILFSLYPIVVWYAIVRHQLMDITIVIRKTAVYSIIATVITVTYFLLIYVMENLFRGFMGYKSIPWTLSMIIVFTLIFQPLKDMVQIFIDRHFFKGSQALLEEELRKTQDELKRSERLKAVGTLAAGMAHEIKNPLTGIKTFTEYLPDKYKDPEFIQKFHKIVSSEINKINDIVQQLLDFSKPKPLQLKPCNIHTLLDQTISFLSNDFIKSNIKVNKNYGPTLPLLNIDHNQIQQVFLNLFLNSIDAMKQGGTLTISTSLQNAAATITIQDTGTGISKKDLEHIFDPFYSTKEKGTGLGMSIVYGIIKEHKGEITVESELGKGTRFTITLSVGAPKNV